MSDAPQYRKPIGTARKFIKRISIDGANYDLCEPSTGDKTLVLKMSKEAGEIDADRKPVNEDAGVYFLARVAIACLNYPGGVRRVFDMDSAEDLAAVKREPWLDEYAKDFGLAFGGKTVEEEKGNSEATPS
ncbi:phage tail protein [Corallococcus exiguus]|uniref:phage tail protein n=1 Tax=Corallococcus exiguus TaxID=83462 RepID=UPI0014730101|nr:phage tail protein [Corallococcus exiguus]MBN8466165.1 phage tail protein [Corallococcus exiguus]NNB96688.1 phage tail protein [Corallococcus exiguus]